MFGIALGIMGIWWLLKAFDDVAAQILVRQKANRPLTSGYVIEAVIGFFIYLNVTMILGTISEWLDVGT